MCRGIIPKHISFFYLIKINKKPMKEERYFFVPNAGKQTELSQEEAAHATRVLRLKEGDEIYLMDGEGSFFRAEITMTSSKRCTYTIKEHLPQEHPWKGNIHIAMAPTKMMERTEWMAEKCTEIGVDELSFLECQFSERRKVRTDRIEKVVVAAAKQSRKAWMPKVNALCTFRQFIDTPRKGKKYICHCYSEIERMELLRMLSGNDNGNLEQDVTVLIGPEGDFSADEVRYALSKGYESVSLGQSRLRTETAAIVATNMIHNIKNIFPILFLAFVMLMVSCGKGEYVDYVPSNSKAVAVVNPMELLNETSPLKSILTPFVSNDKKGLKGIDLTRDFYAFETVDGMFGLCAPVSDVDELTDFMGRMKTMGVTSEFTTNDETTFCVASEQWMIGWQDNCLMAMGPIINSTTERKKMIKRMIHQMHQGQDEGIRSSALWQYIDEIPTPVKMIAQASALPAQFVSACTLGTPQGTDPSDVLLRAELYYADSTLYVQGDMCSYNPNIDQSLKKAAEMYRPITIDWKRVFADTLLAGIFMNVDGEQFVGLLNKNKTLGSMLMGTGSYDRIKGNNGDLAFLFSGKAELGKESAIHTRVMNLPKGNKKNGERLVVTMNIDKAAGPVASDIVQWVSKIHNIVFTLKEPARKENDEQN